MADATPVKTLQNRIAFIINVACGNVMEIWGKAIAVYMQDILKLTSPVDLRDLVSISDEKTSVLCYVIYSR
jgi:hypothetical protein